MSAIATTESLPLLCIGHSHLRCVQVAVGESGAAVETINFWDDNSVVLGYPDNPVLTPELQQRIRDFPGTVFSFMGGSAHVVVGLLSHPRRFDFVLPQAPSLPLDPRAEIIPVDAVRAVLLQQAEPYLKMMRHVRSLTRRRLVHVEPPAPCGDEQRMRPNIPWPLFPGMLREIAPRPVRYKLWRLHSDIVAGFCADQDIAFAGYPRASVDEDGFLLPEFFHDGIHANGKYGALLLRQMQEVA
jgi:hypothetical protein